MLQFTAQTGVPSRARMCGAVCMSMLTCLQSRVGCPSAAGTSFTHTSSEAVGQAEPVRILELEVPSCRFLTPLFLWGGAGPAYFWPGWGRNDLNFRKVYSRV